MATNLQSTAEQSAVIHSETRGLTRVIAYAGTGKTTSLVQYAHERAGARGLYVAMKIPTAKPEL